VLMIPCPWCGPRDEVEFRYGGAALVPYPTDPDSMDDKAWGRYLFVRPNPKGRFVERWCHRSGCRRWFRVVRDTVTQEIGGAGEIADRSNPVDDSSHATRLEGSRNLGTAP
jgi:heterotetrameric sarcosine oxidase delta subunit